MKFILFICFTHLHDMMQYIYIYLTYSMFNGCIQPVWLYLNTNTKFQLLCTVIMTRKATATGARYPYCDL